MQQNRKPKNEPTFIRSSNLQWKRQEYTKGEEQTGGCQEGMGMGRWEKYMREFEAQRKETWQKDEASYIKEIQGQEEEIKLINLPSYTNSLLQ